MDAFVSEVRKRVGFLLRVRSALGGDDESDDEDEVDDGTNPSRRLKFVQPQDSRLLILDNGGSTKTGPVALITAEQWNSVSSAEAALSAVKGSTLRKLRFQAEKSVSETKW